jgi:hypothetical protein
MATATGKRTRRRATPSTEVELTERKEKVLHTRVPESLDRHIKTRARGLGLSVSTVVRHVLLNTFGLVEDIVTDSTNIALAITGESAPASGEIVAWQEVVLNRNAVCDQCNAVLRRGVRAAIAVRLDRGRRAVICPGCLERIGEPAPDPDTQARRRST